MAKKRFRDIKNNKIKTIKQIDNDNNSIKKWNYASSGMKTKAFLTDSFMLLMPIMYIVFYIIMGGRDGFANDKAIGWLYILIPLVIIQTIFMFRTAQTPGYRAYNILLIDNQTGGKASLGLIIFRNLSAILSMVTIIGWIMMYFRKDSKTLHDLLSGTATIIKESTK